MPAQPLGPTGLLAQSLTLPAGSQSMAMGGMGLRAQGMDGRKKGGEAPPPPPSPDTIATAAYWLDSTQGVVGTSPVTSWTDRKLSKVFGNQGSPQFVAGSPPRISFPTSPDNLQTNNLSAVDYSGGNRAAITFAFRTRSSFNNAAILSYGGSFNHFALGINASGVLKAARSDDWSTNDVVDVSALNPNTLYVATAYYASGQLVLRRNFAEVARVGNSFSMGASNNARVSGLADGANHSQSMEAIQAVYFTSAFTLEDIIAVENYFRSQIGI